jgi:site-specific DNA-cytosine methylase
VDCPEELTVASFCTGYGGIERGLGIAGIQHRVVVNVEIEAFAVALLVKAMEEGSMDAAPIWTDLKTFPSERFRGKVDIITAGYPCQPFSVAGNGLGEDDPRHLWPFILRHIKAIKPRWVFLENVRGHVKNGLREVLADLGKAGYRTEWGIFSAEEVGAPHRRERLFIIADSASVGGGKVPVDRNFSGGKVLVSDGQKRGAGNHWAVEPELGRVADGITDRIDRLRILGNGVVPQTAALAWQVLSEKLG